MARAQPSGCGRSRAGARAAAAAQSASNRSVPLTLPQGFSPNNRAAQSSGTPSGTLKNDAA